LTFNLPPFNRILPINYTGEFHMQCPICRKPVEITDEFMPFCSNRCRLIDLGAWASDKYVIPGDDAEERPLPEDDA
jgi:endogenous inhibitor of DNA gyrase (YacG/DUF329 family)